jgi:hypothetical protein
MSRPIAANWLVTLSLILLTFGTGAQAWANLAEFKGLEAALSEMRREAVIAAVRDIYPVVRHRSELPAIRKAAPEVAAEFEKAMEAESRIVLLPFSFLMRALSSPRNALFLAPGYLARIHVEGGDEAVQLARFIRQAQVWTILTMASAIGLAGAAIQLALAYQ